MWAQVINAVLGAWLMAAPGLLDLSSKTADNDHIIGPVIVTFAVTSFWECTRMTQKYNILLGAWLLLAPWLLGYQDTLAIVNDMGVGFLVILLSLVKAKVKKRYGGGWPALWVSNPLHVQEAKDQKNLR